MLLSPAAEHVPLLDRRERRDREEVSAGAAERQAAHEIGARARAANTLAVLSNEADGSDVERAGLDLDIGPLGRVHGSVVRCDAREQPPEDRRVLLLADVGDGSLGLDGPQDLAVPRDEGGHSLRRRAVQLRAVLDGNDGNVVMY